MSAFAGSSGGGESERYAQGSLAQTGVDELAILDGQHNFGPVPITNGKVAISRMGTQFPARLFSVCVSLSFPQVVSLSPYSWCGEWRRQMGSFVRAETRFEGLDSMTSGN